jgi:hypothetical protein
MANRSAAVPAASVEALHEPARAADVAQNCILPYRGLAVRKPCQFKDASDWMALCRMQFGDTAECNSALLRQASVSAEISLRFMAPTHVNILEVFPFHKPRSAAVPAVSCDGVPPPARTPGGTPGELAGEDACATSAGQFMVPMRCIKVAEATDKLLENPPGFGVRQSSGALAMEASQPKAPEDWRSPRRYRAIRRFMVPMHAGKRKEARHEPTRARATLTSPLTGLLN